jgi:hypothetical protein
MNAFGIRHTASRGYIMALLMGLSATGLVAQTEPVVKPPAKLPAPVTAAPKPPVAAPKPPTTPAKPPATETPHPAVAPGNTPAAPAHPAAVPPHPAPAPVRPAAPPPRPATNPTVTRPRPGETITHTPRGDVTRGPRGDVREVRTRDMLIHHGPGASLTIVRERPGNVVLVSNRYGHGYIQRPYMYRNAAFVQRTYYMNGVAYSRLYRPYVLGGVPMNVYAPGYYYPMAFYGWAYNPWGAPIAYSWGWGGSPWYGYYGGYFTPYPVYATPSLWLTDYVVAQTLQADFQERAADLANSQPDFTPMTPQVKQQIADEVNRQINLEYNEAGAGAQTPPDPGSSGVERMLDDNIPHIFVVSSPLYAQSPIGECALTPGDALGLQLGAQPVLPEVYVRVMSSKSNECPVGFRISVDVADLQDMQNHMRETIDQGLGELQKKQGQDGIPVAPAAADAPPVQPAFAEIAPPPDPNAATELSQQTNEARQAELETLSQTGGTGNSPAVAPSKTLTLGQTPDEVIAILGQPVAIVDLGAKKIYSYTNLKVTFTGGKASDIQ